MFWNILKKDIRRKKTMNIILLIFIILASMFTAAGANNIIAVSTGTEGFMKKAGVGDYIAVCKGENSVDSLNKLLDEEESVIGYRTDKVIYGSKENLSHNGEKIDTKNSIIIQSFKNTAIKLFDSNNEEITEVPKGKVMVSGNFMKSNGLEAGDKITFEMESVKMTLELTGTVKDALFGSDFMSNTRFIINDEDFKEFMKDEQIEKYYQGEFYYIDTTDSKAVDSALSEATGVGLTITSEKLKMCYVMEMIVSAIVLIVSICLVIVAFLVLRFTINFTIIEEYREIGVMKAIGIKNFKIRLLYIFKYLAMAIVGAIVGLILSIPFGDTLLDSASASMVLDNDMGIIVNVLGVLFVVVITVMFAYLCTGKVKKATPVDAIRNGQTGERFKKKKGFRLGKSRTNTSFYLALNDFVSAPKKFLSIIVTFTLCSLLVFVIVNATDTMCSENLIDLFHTKSDIYVTDVDSVMGFMTADGREKMEKFFAEKEKMLADEGMPGECLLEIQYKYKVISKGKDYSLICQQGYKTHAEDYAYTEGTAPTNKNEIAVTKQVAKEIDAAIGDEVIIDFGGKEEKCIITAYFQTMNNLGDIVRFHEDAPTDFAYMSGSFSYQINFDDNPDAKTIDQRKERLKEILDNDKVFNTGEYCADSVAVVDTMKAVEKMLLLITILVIILVTMLMERSFVSDEKGQIAILKAIGFRDGTIIKWHMFRFGIVALVSEIIAIILSLPASKLLITPVFRIMGAESIKFSFDPIKVCIVYPIIIVGATLVIAFITSLCTKSIKSNDTASIE